MTCERFSLVKTSGIGLSGNFPGVGLVLFAVENAGKNIDQWNWHGRQLG